jgi:tRNA 2-thiouridine synthesizing protein E
MEQWSEAFAIAQAEREGLALTDEHWQVVRFIREYYEDHNVQAQVRDMVMHFRTLWGPEKGNSRYLHDIFPMGGPQKQGNRIAGIRKTKGEH